jgi:hypothetical protein
MAGIMRARTYATAGAPKRSVPWGSGQAQLSRHSRKVHRSISSTRALPIEAIGWGLFFTPGLAGLAYAAIRGKGDLKDGLSHLLTLLSQGYLQPDVGGKDIPEAGGDLSEFTGSYITFLYDQCASPHPAREQPLGPLRAACVYES